MKLKKIKKAFALLAICLLSVLHAFGQNGRGELPDTSLGKIVREWLKVIESGSGDEIEKFIELRFSANARKNQPDAAAYFRKLHRQSGGLKVISVTPPAGEHPMYLLVKSKRGDNFARIIVGLDRAESEKLAGIGVAGAENPNGKKLSEINKKLSETEMIAAIRAEVERRAAKGKFSGVVLVARNDRILFHNAYGFADREAKIPNTLETGFHLASVGKMFTAAAIAQLANAGKLSFEDAVGKILPDFPNEEIKKITIHQLLSHTAGMGTFFESPGFKRGKTYANSTEEIEVYKDEKLYFEPGARWRYSNAGYSLLGAIIERVSGKTYQEYIRENIFAPLKMGEQQRSASPNSVLYTQPPDDPLGLEPYRANKWFVDSIGTGYGGGFMSTGDLFKFSRALFTGKLLGEKMTETVLKGKVYENGENSRHWGYGNVSRKLNNHLIVGHSGGGRTDVQMIWMNARIEPSPVTSYFSRRVSQGVKYTVIVQTNATPPPATALSGEILEFMTKQLSPYEPVLPF